MEKRCLWHLDTIAGLDAQAPAHLMERPSDNAQGEVALAASDHLNDEALSHRHAVFNERELEVSDRRSGGRVETANIARVKPGGDGLEATGMIPVPHLAGLIGSHARRGRPHAEPAAILRRDRDRNWIVGEGEHKHTVEHVVRMQTLAVDRQHVRRRGNNRFKLVG